MLAGTRLEFCLNIFQTANRSPAANRFDCMPTYEYACQKCGQNFDAFQSMRDEPFAVCPKELCRLPEWGKGNVKRLLGTGAGVIFKGSGFIAAPPIKKRLKKIPGALPRRVGEMLVQRRRQSRRPRVRRAIRPLRKKIRARDYGDQAYLRRLPARKRIGADLLSQLRRPA